MKAICLLLVSCLTVQHVLCQSDCFGEGLPKRPNSPLIAKGADTFGMKLFTDIAISYPLNSIVLSPFSVWSVLNLAYFGAEGSTKTQLQAALGVPSKAESFYGSVVVDTKLKANKGTTFLKADKAYFANDIKLRQCSLDKLTQIERLNFKTPDIAAAKINADVSEITNGTIKNFLNGGIIANARFILINAVYFRGFWKSPFPESKTVEKPFYDEDRARTVSNAKMMTTQAKLRYVKSQELGAEILELPYEGSNFAMFIVLPTFQTSTVNSVLKKMTSDSLDKVVNDFTTKQVLVTMPRFKMTTRIADELKAGLTKLGIVDLFSAQDINLTSFIPSERVVLDSALHHATIEVSEKGTIAAAATGLIGTRSGVAQIVNFNADRPFIFMIRDVSQGLSLFVGVLRNPNHTTPF